MLTPPFCCQIGEGQHIYATKFYMQKQSDYEKALSALTGLSFCCQTLPLKFYIKVRYTFIIVCENINFFENQRIEKTKGILTFILLIKDLVMN